MRRYLVTLSVLLLAGSVRAAEQDDAGRELRRVVTRGSTEFKRMHKVPC